MVVLRLLPLLLLGAACDSTRGLPAEGAVRADGFSLTADHAAYDTNDAVALTLRNDGDGPGETGVLDCATLEVRSEAGWAMSPDGNDRACIMIALTVEPGDSLTAEVPLGVPDGTYRFTHGVSGVTVATASFEVR